ncbi:MAG: RdgB/HAM1 family non-canonical purine NTP pyrophosphatase [Clostridiales Family XIII bacterium]|jgi:XTP/dITP diphosphohydrolase|nr:RdgB/HAM1 family non-canonical purine NTP pyrophosphatase [Clostridiales Family XIII bacterium]
MHNEIRRTAFIVATGNRHKVDEMRAVLSPVGIDLCTVQEAGFGGYDPEETGSTFEENALIKARGLAALSGQPVIADDSGLCVDALDGAPGVYSARFAGEGATDGENNAKLLHLLSGRTEDGRRAHFVSVIAACLPDGREITAQGACHGQIAQEASGAGGFGYDPLFIPDDYALEGLSFADLPAESKNRISHRARALAAFVRLLPEGIGTEDSV